MDENNHHNNGFATNGLFAGSQNFNAYENLSLFPNGHASSFNEASWGINASNPSAEDKSRALLSPAPPSWQQDANQLSAQSAAQGFNQASAYSGRPMNRSPVSFAEHNYSNFDVQQSYQYPQPQYDPSLTAQGNNQQGFPLRGTEFKTSAQNAGTIVPTDLDHNRAFANPPYGYSQNNIDQNKSTSNTPQASRVDHAKIASSIPKGVESGMFSVISFDDLSNATTSERMTIFANIGKVPVEWDITRSAIPSYVPRTSRNELRRLVGNNTAALARIGKKSKSAAAAQKRAKSSTAAGPSSLLRTKSEADSSTEYSSSSEDDSDADSDDDSESPLPGKRPDSPKDGVEYDVIKAIYRPRKKHIDGASIRKGLADFWEIVKTIRDRWKADAGAVTDAMEKNKAGEVPFLKSRVKDQREMAETAFRAALKHGSRGVIELFSENVALMFLCYQFLLDRFKEDDLNCSLTRAILELMSTFTTLTQEKMEKTHLVKVFPRYQKKGDAKTQYWVKKILANAATATQKAMERSNQKKLEDPPVDGAVPNVASPSGSKSTPQSITGVKRAAPSLLDGAAQKKAATENTKVNGAAVGSRVNATGAVKKTVSEGTASKTSTTTSLATRKTVVAKPSGVFTSLQSATKKPGTSNAEKAVKPAGVKLPGSNSGATTSARPAFSFAETMANLSKPKEEKKVAKPEQTLPPETEEERTKRVRKEQRRKLHVRFKPADELVQIKYFTHDPAEEIDHDSSQMRDVSDVGGEGRMLKQQQHMMDIDEDEEDTEETKLVEFKSPLHVDFTVVDPEERKRNYAPYGGGEREPDSAEKVKLQKHDNDSLMVFYADASEIPPDPKEPMDPYNGDQGDKMRSFGAIDSKYAFRAGETALRRTQQYAPTPYQLPQNFAGLDIATALAKQQEQPAGPPTANVQSILASLARLAPSQANALQHQDQQAVAGPTLSFVGGQASSSFQTPVPPQAIAPQTGQIDLAAILASITPGGQNQQLSGFNYGQQPQQQVHQFQNTEVSDQRGKNPLYKTRPCRFFQEGRCHKGDACSYLH